jgi:NADPH-dependent ferric siderophore reductase
MNGNARTPLTPAAPPQDRPPAPDGTGGRDAHEVPVTRRSLCAVVSARAPLGAARVRLTFSGADVATFIRTKAAQAPGAWIKLFITGAGGDSVGRAYTVRRFDLVKGCFDVDFVLHERGPLSQWARSASAGASVEFAGPRDGGFTLHAQSRWIVLIGDETALPAIQAILENLPVDFPGIVLIESEHADQTEAVFVGPNMRLSRVSQGRGGVRAAPPLLAALERLPILPGAGQAWVAGESDRVMAIQHVLQEKWALAATSICARRYWKEGVARR